MALAEVAGIDLSAITHQTHTSMHIPTTRVLVPPKRQHERVRQAHNLPYLIATRPELKYLYQRQTARLRFT